MSARPTPLSALVLLFVACSGRVEVSPSVTPDTDVARADEGSPIDAATIDAVPVDAADAPDAADAGDVGDIGDIGATGDALVVPTRCPGATAP